MCGGSKLLSGDSSNTHMEDGEFHRAEGSAPKISILLELSASDDLAGLRCFVEEGGLDVSEAGYWYGRSIGSKKMAIEKRTPLMVAATYGSKQVLSYVLQKGEVDVNNTCGSDEVTALHCAVAGGSASSFEVVKLLLDAGADVDLVDANGNRPADLISRQGGYIRSRRKLLELVLNGSNGFEEATGLADQTEVEEAFTSQVPKDVSEKKGFPVDPSLPDINDGIYGMDEFRMYTFKVKPCSRAYSHDWTECPFVHPGENARRRDPRKYHYTCVPCPDFRKGTCQRGDGCEYAHGIFECWLHPAQYRTRMCKDEEQCTRRVCFFAHKPEELRPLYASTGSAMPSPRSFSINASPYDLAPLSPHAYNSTSVMMPSTSTPHMTPSAASSAIGGSIWPNQPNIAPPTLQLPGSRLKTAVHARDVDFDAPISCLSSPSNRSSNLASAAFADRNGILGRGAGIRPTNLDNLFGGLDPSVLSQLEALSLDAGQFHSPNGLHMRQNLNLNQQLSYNSSLSSSGTAAAVLTSRSAAFAKRSHSFTDRSAANLLAGASSPHSAAPLLALSDWSSPDGKLDWGIQREELNKLRKSASFGPRNSGSNSMRRASSPPDVPWGAPSRNPGQLEFENKKYHFDSGRSEMHPSWADQPYAEHEQIVA